MAHTLDEVRRHTSNRRCLIDDYLTRLVGTPDLQPVLRAMRDLERVPHRQIASWLTGEGMPVGDSAVYDFRRRGKLAAWLETHGVVVEDA